MHDEQLRPVLDRLLATRRAKVEDTQSGARKGLRVLFTCHSGKNKLLAAQLFAHELSVDLFQIDLNRIVSKYVAGFPISTSPSCDCASNPMTVSCC